MNGTITAVYERGMLRPLTPLTLPEHNRVQINIFAQPPVDQADCQKVRQTLLDAGVIHPHPSAMSLEEISEAQLAEASKALAEAGSLSELIIAERDER